MCDRDIVDENLNAALSPLTDHEQEVMKYLKEDIFGNMTQRHWEGAELVDYWKAIKEL